MGLRLPVAYAFQVARPDLLHARALDDATAVAASHPAKDNTVAREVHPWTAPA
jgi:hypothetical protein